MRRHLLRLGGTATTVAVAAALTAAPAPAGTTITTSAATPTSGTVTKADQATRLAERLVRKVNASAANRHLTAFQRIGDTHGSRADQTPGYEASVDYVAGKLRDAGLRVDTPEFTYEVEVPDATDLIVGDTTFHVDKMEESIDTPEGGLTGPLVVVPEDPVNGTGCFAEDYEGLPMEGGIAVIRRGLCNFEQKALLAADAGAIAAVITNNIPGPLTSVTITNTGPIPVGGMSMEDGDVVAGLDGTAATLDLRYHPEDRTSVNVIAETRTGRDDNVVMAGAHLDSVPEGAGVNDNGSGSAALLDVALKLGSRPNVNNTVRFAWWGAEELGLIGSNEYVAGLSFEEQLDIALYLNFDMVASPNAGYFVYDGDDSDGEGEGPGPYGSAQIEATFADFITDRLDVPTQGTDFTGRSDYGPFIAVGIPSGGLFTGAEGIKTAEQAALWGGEADVAYDPCYHQACDTLGNVDRAALDRNLDAMAWATGVYAWSTEDVNGVPPREERALMRASAFRTAVMDFHDVHLATS